MTERSLNIEKRGAHFYLVTEDGEIRGLGYANRREAEEALGVLMRSAQHSIRACMSCGRPFQSDGIHNRRCNDCKRRGTG